MTETINRADFWRILVPNFLLFSNIFANFAVENFAVENRKNGLRLGNSNEFDCSRFAPSLHRLIE